MTAIEINDLSGYDTLMTLDDGGRQVRGGDVWLSWGRFGAGDGDLNYYLDGYKAGKYNLRIVQDVDDVSGEVVGTFLLFTLASGQAAGLPVASIPAN